MKENANRTRRWVLLSGAVIVAGAIAFWQVGRIPPDYVGKSLTVQQAFEQAQKRKIILLDIRTPNEWRSTGVGEAAFPLDMRREDFISVVTQLVEQDKSRPVALICAGGVRSARMSNRLTEAGFTNIIDVPEGMFGSAAGPGWIRAGLPVSEHKGGA